MALTFTVTNLIRNVAGNKRQHQALVTTAGTVTAAGADTITAAALGLHTIENITVQSPAVDSAATPTVAYAVRFTPVTGGLTGRLAFFGTNATPGAAVADPIITAGTTLTSYSFNVLATGT